MATFCLTFELRRRGEKNTSENDRVLLLYYQAINSGSICYNEKSICNDMSQELLLSLAMLLQPPSGLETIRLALRVNSSSLSEASWIWQRRQRSSTWMAPRQKLVTWTMSHPDWFMAGSENFMAANECVYEIIPDGLTWLVVECPKKYSKQPGFGRKQPICIYLLSRICG